MKQTIHIFSALILLLAASGLSAAPIQEDDRVAVTIHAWWGGLVEQAEQVFSFLGACTGGDCPAGGGQSGPEPGVEPEGGSGGEQEEDGQAPCSGNSCPEIGRQ